jgi:hypothetical protein
LVVSPTAAHALALATAGAGASTAPSATGKTPKRRYTTRFASEGGLTFAQIIAECGFGASTIRPWFRDEPGIRAVVHKQPKRGEGRVYKSLRIPRTVVDGVLAPHTQLAAPASCSPGRFVRHLLLSEAFPFCRKIAGENPDSLAIPHFLSSSYR